MVNHRTGHTATSSKEQKINREILYSLHPPLNHKGEILIPKNGRNYLPMQEQNLPGPVAEHHDGFSMWASKANPWNAGDMGPKIDLVGMLTDAIRKKNMKVILSMHHAYHITGFYDSVPYTNDSKLQILYGQLGKEKNEALWLNKHKEIIDSLGPRHHLGAILTSIKFRNPFFWLPPDYYNRAAEWGKKRWSRTYKDGLNMKCAVLDYERGGPTDNTVNYWLTDDAISKSSWC